MELFPVNIAIGKAFCNRIKERKLLRHYINQVRPVVLIAPRRYGKTSLIHETLLELKIPHCMIELTMAISLKDIEQIIVRHVGTLLHSILPRTTKAKQNILNLFKWLNPELILTVGGQKLVLHPEQNNLSPVENIAEALKKLDKAAVLAKKKVVVVMDEFQQLSDIEDSGVEASIRHAMQYSKQVSYVFSGSNRHMLLCMFNDKNRPFYNSCEIMKIERIAEAEYASFIQKAALEQWGKSLPPDVLQEILNLSELHSSYINRICGHFWLLNEFPTISTIQQYWYDLVESKRAEFTEDILNLSKNQRKLLCYLANNPTAHPSHREVCRAVELSEASIRQATKALTLKDYIYKDKQKTLRILDPALRDFIRNINP